MFPRSYILLFRDNIKFPKRIPETQGWMTLQYPVPSAPFGVSWGPSCPSLNLNSIILVPMALAPVLRHPF